MTDDVDRLLTDDAAAWRSARQHTDINPHDILTDSAMEHGNANSGRWTKQLAAALSVLLVASVATVVVMTRHDKGKRSAAPVAANTATSKCVLDPAVGFPMFPFVPIAKTSAAAEQGLVKDGDITSALSCRYDTYIDQHQQQHDRVSNRRTVPAAEAASLAAELNKGHQVGPNDKPNPTACIFYDGAEDVIWFEYADGTEELVIHSLYPCGHSFESRQVRGWVLPSDLETLIEELLVGPFPEPATS